MSDPTSFPAWGEPGTPVLPAAVRERAADVMLHGPLLAALNIDPSGGPDARFTKPLDEPVDSAVLGGALRSALNRGLGEGAAMGSAGGLLRLVHPDDFEGLVPRIGWRRSTENAVRTACVNESLTVYELLMTFTISGLLELPGLGAVALFDL